MVEPATEKTFWGLDSFIQVCYGLKMFDRESIKVFYCLR